MTKSIPVKKAALMLVAGVAVFFAMLFMNERKGADVATEE